MYCINGVQREPNCNGPRPGVIRVVGDMINVLFVEHETNSTIRRKNSLDVCEQRAYGL